MKGANLQGLIAAAVTPMHEDGTIDERSLRKYLRWLISQGVHGVAVNVDTGEGPHLFPEERLRVLELATEEINGRAIIVAGLAAAFTRQAVETARATARFGVDALLVFPIPAYQGAPFDPDVAIGYHQAIAEAADVPLIAFQLQPALGGVIYGADALSRLLDMEAIVAIKEASFDARQFVDTARLVQKLTEPVTILNGNDNFLLEAYLLGAQGALLGFGTLAAAEQVAMLQAVKLSDFKRATELGRTLQALCDVVFAPPIRNYRARIKHALRRLEVIECAAVRLPLPPLKPSETQAMDQALKDAGLIA
jgi:4-hydroxy-tetrahydrodipicolinate synthase